MTKAGQSNSTKKQSFLRIELLPAYLLILISFAKLLAEISYEYNWDFDHLMYSAGRYLQGEFNWTVEFEEKLPVVIYLLAIPAKLHSELAWQLMSAVGIAIGCLAVYRLAYLCMRDHLPELDVRVASVMAFYGAATAACLFALMPGGFTHINAIAASFAIAAIALVDAARRACSGSRMLAAMMFLLAAFSASLAIGVRPYFLFPLLLAGVWTALKFDPQAAAPGGRTVPLFQRLFTRTALVWIVAWGTCVGIFGLLVNVVPYLLIGRLDALVAGLTMMAQDFIFRDMFSNIVFQCYVLLHESGFVVFATMIWLLSVVCLPILAYKRFKAGDVHEQAILDFGYLVIICPFILELTILLKHFWPHYFQMFAPFIGIGVALFGGYLVATGEMHLSRFQKRALVVATLVLILVSAKEQIADSLERIAKFPSDHHPQALQLADFKAFLAGQPEDKRDFLNPTHMHFHWQLAEPRRGFPHAAHTKRIMAGKWRNTVEIPEPLQLPTSPEAYCEMLEERGPTFIVELETTDVILCFLDNTNSSYTPVDTATYADNLVIYQRTR